MEQRGSSAGSAGSAGSGGQAAPRSAAGRVCRQRCGPWALLPRLCLALALLTPVRALPPPPRHRLAEGLSRSREMLEAAKASLHRLKVCQGPGEKRAGAGSGLVRGQGQAMMGW